VGAAAGLAMRGWTPVVHGLAAFLVMRAFEFIRTDVGIGRLPVKLVGFIPGVLSDANGPTHQALEDVSLMRGIPGMQVVCPADESDLVQAMEAVLSRPGPCYIRYAAAEAAVEHTKPFEVGKAEVLSEGEAVALLTYGSLLAEVAEAARILEDRGAPIRLVNMRSLAPVDEGAIVEAARRTHVIATIEDHFRVGGLYSIVCEVLAQYGLTRRVIPIAFDQRWFQPALLPDVLRAEGLTGPQIADRVLRATLEA
jgi:transketolase